MIAIVQTGSDSTSELHIAEWQSTIGTVVFQSRARMCTATGATLGSAQRFGDDAARAEAVGGGQRALAQLVAAAVAEQEAGELGADGLVVALLEVAAAGDQVAAGLAARGEDLVGDDREGEGGAAEIGELPERSAGGADRRGGGYEEPTRVAGCVADLDGVAGGGGELGGGVQLHLVAVAG